MSYINWGNESLEKRKARLKLEEEAIYEQSVRMARIKQQASLAGSSSSKKTIGPSAPIKYKQAQLPDPSYTTQTIPQPDYVGEIIDGALYPINGYPYIRLENGNLAEIQYCQAILKNGIIIYEGYDRQTEDEIDGYWIAFEQDANDPTLLNKVAELKMTAQFWDNWYDWTVKDGDDNQVKFVTANYPNSSEVTLESWITELTYSNGTLTAVDTSFDFDGNTVASLYTSFQEEPIPELGGWFFRRPEYILDDDYYGMAVGTQTGWSYYRSDAFGDKRNWNTVGFNILTGETRYIEPVDTIYDTVTNFNFTDVDEDTLISDWQNHPHGIAYSFSDAQLVNDGNNVNGITAIWSPYFENPNEVLYITMRDSLSGIYLVTRGSFGPGNLNTNWYWDNENFYYWQYANLSSARCVIVQQFNVNTKEVKTYNIPLFETQLEYTSGWANNDGLMFYFREGSNDPIFGQYRYHYLHKDGGYSVLQSNNYYPTNMLGNKTYSHYSQLLRNIFNLGVEIDEYANITF